jgi:hypothetical protein
VPVLLGNSLLHRRLLAHHLSARVEEAAMVVVAWLLSPLGMEREAGAGGDEAADDELRPARSLEPRGPTKNSESSR